jgi:putative transposase
MTACVNRRFGSKPLPGLVHHSDRGIQYATEEYVAILKKHAIEPSMSRPANPYDNASCESFIKTLKREEIYANLDDLRDHLEEFIERYYNQKRLHSALGYRSPEEFEQQTECVAALCSATVRFFARKDDKSSTELLGEGTQTPSLPPDPISAGESTT